MVMPQALAQVTFPVSLQWSLTQLEEPHWLQYVCQLLEMCLIRLMRFEQSKVCATFSGLLTLHQQICMGELMLLQGSTHISGLSAVCLGNSSLRACAERNSKGTHWQLLTVWFYPRCMSALCTVKLSSRPAYIAKASCSVSLIYHHYGNFWWHHCTFQERFSMQRSEQ